jgi:class 3 adenylate cyclase
VKCSGCGHKNRDAAKFCEECAAPLTRKCAGCGAELRPVAKFCDECATPVTRAPPTRSADPRPYTPKHLAEKILTARSALEGERKQVTVRFADVQGSVTLAEQVDPEKWHGILERFFQILADGVHRFEGTVNQYTGDGIMALFGAPIAHEDHAQRACYAALHLQQELRRYADEIRLEHGLGCLGPNGTQLRRGRGWEDRR